MRLLVVVCVCSRAQAWTELLGTVAPVSTVLERDLGKQWQTEAAAAWQQGRSRHWLQRQKEVLHQWLERPEGMNLPTTTVHNVFRVDPGLRLTQEIRDQRGVLWYPAGTRVNPLTYLQYRKVLCFINADEAAQWEWLQRRCAQPLVDRWILVQGAYMQASNQHQHRLYFDQYGRLAQRFALRSVPARVYQVGSSWQVEEEPVNAEP